MDLQIQANGFSVATELREFIEKKLTKLETFHDKIISATVYLKLDSHQQIKEKISEIKLNIPGSTLFASEHASTFEESVDLATEAIRRQLKRQKEKMR